MIKAIALAAVVMFDGQGKVPVDYDRNAWTCTRGACVHQMAPKWPMAWFMNSKRTDQREDAWYRVDLTPYLPEGTQAVSARFTGMLLISYGRAIERCTLNVYVRSLGSTVEHPTYRATTMRPIGERSNFSGEVLLVDNTFEVKWTRSWRGHHPAHCSAGVNINITSVVIEGKQE